MCSLAVGSSESGPPRLLFKTDAVRADLAATSSVIERWALPLSVLGPEDGRRYEAFRSDRDRWDFLAARLLAREVVGPLVGQQPKHVRITQTCDHCGGPHGRPSTEAAHVSWSHSEGFVAAAAGHGPVAVDVERWTRPVPSDDMLRRCCSRQELDAFDFRSTPGSFFELWVLKECLVKLGRTTLDTMSRVDLSDVLSSLPCRWVDLDLRIWRRDDFVVGLASASELADVP
jgi:4'-phosphopantetheinyl transferase